MKKTFKIAVIALVLCSFVASPAFVSAASQSRTSATSNISAEAMVTKDAEIKSQKAQIDALKKQIKELQAQVAKLKKDIETKNKKGDTKRPVVSVTREIVEDIDVSGPTTNVTPSPTACYTFTKNIHTGIQNAQVARLWEMLAREGFLPVRTYSSQSQAQIFGEQMGSAISSFQEKYAADILTPAGLTNGNGFFGTATRAKMNELYGCN